MDSLSDKDVQFFQLNKSNIHMKRTIHTTETKTQALSKLFTERVKLEDVSKEFNIPPNTLMSWVKRVRTKDNKALIEFFKQPQFNFGFDDKYSSNVRGKVVGGLLHYNCSYSDLSDQTQIPVETIEKWHKTLLNNLDYFFQTSRTGSNQMFRKPLPKDFGVSVLQVIEDVDTTDTIDESEIEDGIVAEINAHKDLYPTTSM